MDIAVFHLSYRCSRLTYDRKYIQNTAIICSVQNYMAEANNAIHMSGINKELMLYPSISC